MTAKKTTASKTTETKPAAKAECNVPDCTRKPTIRGLCDGHYQSRRGDADPKTKRKG
jgi:hypothetical protein